MMLYIHLLAITVVYSSNSENLVCFQISLIINKAKNITCEHFRLINTIYNILLLCKIRFPELELPSKKSTLFKGLKYIAQLF